MGTVMCICINKQRGLSIGSPLSYLLPSFAMCDMPSAASFAEIGSDGCCALELVCVHFDKAHGFLLCLEDHLWSHSDWAIDSMFGFSHSVIRLSSVIYGSPRRPEEDNPFSIRCP